MDNTSNLMEIIYNKFNDSVKVSIFSKLKTNNPIIDTILSTLVLTFMSYFVQLAYKKDLFAFLSEKNWYCNLTDKIKCCFYQKNTIHIIGKKCMMTNSYIGNPKLSLVCSDTYRAVWQNIISNHSKIIDNYAEKYLKLYPYLDKFYHFFKTKINDLSLDVIIKKFNYKNEVKVFLMKIFNNFALDHPELFTRITGWCSEPVFTLPKKDVLEILSCKTREDYVKLFQFRCIK